MKTTRTAQILGVSTALWVVMFALFGAPLGWILAPFWVGLLSVGFYVSFLFLINGLLTEAEPDDPDKTVRIAPPIWASTDPEPPTVPLTFDGYSPPQPRSR